MTVDYRLRKHLLEGLTIDTRPFNGLHATDQCEGSASSLSLLLSMVSCFESLDKIQCSEIRGGKCQIGTPLALLAEANP